MKLYLLLFLLATSPMIFAAETGELPLCKPKVKTIAAFKNGLGFVFKAGEVQLNNGWARIEELPPAALGSIWLGTTSKNGPVSDVISYKDKAITDADAVT